jgi:hypothetical protein
MQRIHDNNLHVGIGANMANRCHHGRLHASLTVKQIVGYKHTVFKFTDPNEHMTSLWKTNGLCLILSNYVDKIH